MIDAEPSGRWFEALVSYLADGLARAEDMAAFVVDAPDGQIASVALGAVYQAPPGPTYTGHTGCVHLVSTHPRRRHRGYARAVTCALLSWLQDRRCGLVTLNTSPDAAPLYHSLGFRENPAAMRLFPH